MEHLGRRQSAGRAARNSSLKDPWADPKSRSTIRFHSQPHRNIRVQNWGVLLFGSFRGKGVLDRILKWDPKWGFQYYSLYLPLK